VPALLFDELYPATFFVVFYYTCVFEAIQAITFGHLQTFTNFSKQSAVLVAEVLDLCWEKSSLGCIFGCKKQ
jgi:hypothetical protein